MPSSFCLHVAVTYCTLWRAFPYVLVADAEGWVESYCSCSIILTSPSPFASAGSSNGDLVTVLAVEEPALLLAFLDDTIELEVLAPAAVRTAAFMVDVKPGVLTSFATLLVAALVVPAVLEYLFAAS